MSYRKAIEQIDTNTARAVVNLHRARNRKQDAKELSEVAIRTEARSILRRLKVAPTTYFLNNTRKA